MRTFDDCVRGDYATALTRMVSFTDDFLEVGTSAKKDEYLVKALVEIIRNDKDIPADTMFYINEDGLPSTKKQLLTITAVCFQAFLVGVWHYIIMNRQDNNGAFCIAKSRALRDYTPSRYRKRYITFTPAAVSELTSMPCIFAKRNMHFGYTEASHPALLGRITDIRAQGETIKICFSGFQGVPQQLLNQNVGLLGMVHASLRNELDEEHWSIKGCNLIDVMARLQVDIE